MTDIANIAPPRVPRRRLAIAGDGSVTGDAASDQLGATLRYACRMASQIEPLLEIGPLQWLSTLSGTAVTARVGQNAGGVTLTAEIEERAARTPLSVPSTDPDGAHAAIRKCLRRVRDGLDAEWGAVITWDKRLAGAFLPEAGSKRTGVREVLSEVGLRALAVVGSLDESYRETAVLLEYRQGSLLVVAVEGDVVFAFADRFDKSIAGPVIDGVRAALAPHDLDLVWTWGESWTHE